MIPLVKYAGGKRAVLEQFKGIFPSKVEGKYYEPMVGSGAVFLGLYDRIPGGVILGDASEYLCEMWMAVVAEPGVVAGLVGEWCERYNAATPRLRERMYDAAKTSIRHGPATKTMVTALFGKIQMVSARAFNSALFIVVNRTCFNGLWRVNQSGLFNVPWGKYKTVPTDMEARILKVGTTLGEGFVEVRSGDYRTSTSDAQEYDLVYFDPPYHKNFDQYTPSRFKWDQQVWLAAWAKDLSEVGVRIFASNSNTPEIRDLWSWAKCHEIEVRRTISCKAETRGKGIELLFEAGGTGA